MLPTSAVPARQRSGRAAWLQPLRWPLLAATAAFVLQLILCAPLIAGYVPTQDEIAIEVNSTPVSGTAVDPAHWFRDGFHGYFTPYAEWGEYGSDYWRPVANVLFWLHYQIFGTHFASQLVLGYLAHAAVVGLVTHIALNVLLLPGVYTALAALIAFFSPGYWTHSRAQAIPPLLQYPIYQTEVLCAILVLISYLAFLKRRYIWVALILTVAVCLKETALTAPVSAAIMVLLTIGRSDWRRALGEAALLLVPLMVWVLAHMFVFRHGTHLAAMHSYGTSRFAFLLHVVRNGLLWPTVLYVGPLPATWHALVRHDWRVVTEHGLALLLNTGWWALLAGALIMQFSRHRAGEDLRTDPSAVALMFALGNLGLVMLVQDPVERYGYLWFALGPAALFAMLLRLKGARRWGLPLATALSSGLIISQAISALAVRSPAALKAYGVAKAASAGLVALLARTPPNATVYLIDDYAVNPSTPKFVSMLAGAHRRLVLVNSVDPMPGCLPRHPGARQLPRLLGSGADLTLQYGTAAECYTLGWLGYMPPIRDGAVQRGPWLTYHFPNATERVTSVFAGRTEVEHGEGWWLHASDPACAQPDGCRWVIFDPQSHEYLRLMPIPAGAGKPD